jgi:dTDP-4-dehydrorhamnose reductase
VLVLGAAGMLGHKLCQGFARRELPVVGLLRDDPASWRARFPGVFDRVTLLGGVDVLEEGRIERALRELRPRAVVNAVGIVKQLAAAEDRYLSIGINAWLPHRLARACHEVGARLVHVSTDCVFDGTRGGYTEDDPSDAVDLYGKSKYLGETDARELAAITLRTSIVGRELKRPTHGLFEWFLAQRGGKVRGFAKAIYSGFTTLELTRVVQLAIEHPAPLCGTYHVASQPINKYDLLLLVRRIFDLEVEIERDEQFACDRSLRMERFSRATGYVPPTWEAMIVEMRDDPTPYGDGAAARGGGGPS